MNKTHTHECAVCGTVYTVPVGYEDGKVCSPDCWIILNSSNEEVAESLRLDF